MTPTQPLHTLLAHAERERNAALAAVARLDLEHSNAVRQTEQLQTYRSDYERRWSSQFSQSGEIAIVQCYQAFVTRLGQAIEAQQRSTLLAAQRLAGAQAVWQQQEMRVASVRKLLERRGSELRSIDDQREQKELDEYAARLLWNRAKTSDARA